ncbi:response regulator transcription factor [Trinickia violacea]|uniref:Response regulator transcription factor n=1 Tax=Trinickia violacea TaxID=2571746 RepID=A0A4P8IY61_9BURK|nr:response regulator transcription factor [Trinickia violacea]QCP54358.1 response regulator transcription factor [Trinickia violacea]QCP54463.1 response regulator transcription factor [Trinickia violacea]
MRVLSLEDEPAQAELVRTALEAAGHQVWSFERGRAAIRHLENATVDLLILDWKVPDITGIEVLGWARTRLGHQLPVIMLTNHATEDHAVQSLEGGADAHLVKPMRMRELMAHVTALLRRAYPEATRRTEFSELGAYRLDLRERIAKVGDRILSLTPREFELAWLLFRSAGQIVPREQLFTRVWGRDRMTWDSRSLDTHVYRLRRKLELREHGLRLRSVYQHGYCLEQTLTTGCDATSLAASYDTPDEQSGIIGCLSCKGKVFTPAPALA